MLTVRQAMCSREICINNGGILYWYIFLGVSECFNPEKKNGIDIAHKIQYQTGFIFLVSFKQAGIDTF